MIRFATGPASASEHVWSGVSGSRSNTVTPPNSESEMCRGVRPIHRPTIAWPTSWNISDIMSATEVTRPAAQYTARPRPGAAAGNTASANVHAVRPTARRHEMSGRTARASVETPAAARSAPPRGRGTGRTTDAIDVRSGGEGVHRGHRIFRTDPDVRDGQHRRVVRADEQ